MSYSFERVRTASIASASSAIVRRTVKVLEDICGVDDQGLALSRLSRSARRRSISCRRGLRLGQSACSTTTCPICSIAKAGTLIEIPFTTSTADKTYIGYPYPMRGGPDGSLDVWKSEFDVLYRESERGAALHDPQHPDLGDRPAGAAAHAAAVHRAA